MIFSQNQTNNKSENLIEQFLLPFTTTLANHAACNKNKFHESEQWP